nr:hypothetical protein B0A51_14256 [Rachicladosporium sp. CCFEE 5018]
MAPTKKEAAADKETKLTLEQSSALILDYLRKTNRPYSATDISTNLKNRVTKTAAAKLLKDMHERSKIEGRAAGKQIVYHVIQQPPEEGAVEALNVTEEETVKLKDDTANLKLQEKALRNALREGATVVPLAELKGDISVLGTETAEIEARLEKLKGGNVKPVSPVSPEEREEIAKQHKLFSKTATARRRICVELWKDITGLECVSEEEAENLRERFDLPF